MGFSYRIRRKSRDLSLCIPKLCDHRRTIRAWLSWAWYIVESTTVAYLLDLTRVDNQAFGGRSTQHYLPEFLHLPTIRCNLGILR